MGYASDTPPLFAFPFFRFFGGSLILNPLIFEQIDILPFGVYDTFARNLLTKYACPLPVTFGVLVVTLQPLPSI